MSKKEQEGVTMSSAMQNRKIYVAIFIVPVVLALIIIAVISLQKQPHSSTATQYATSALNFSEDFSSDLLKDTGNTTAVWDTVYERLGLPAGAGNWYKSDDVNLGYDNISNNSGSSESVSLVLDSQGNPAMAWADITPGNWEILYSSHNGTSWSAPVNVSNNAGASELQSLVLDSQDNPAMAWDDGTTGNDEILYSSYNGTSWSASVNVSNNASSSQQPSLVLDSQDNPAIAWSNVGQIFYSSYNGTSWSTPVNVGSTGSNPSLVLDSQDNPAVAWEDSSPGNYEIFYSSYNGTSWSTPVNLSNNASVSRSTSLALDSQDNPAIAWHDNTLGNYEIFYSSYNGTSWDTAVNVSNEATVSSNPSLALDSQDNPALAWDQGSFLAPDIYHSSYNGTSWSTPVNLSNNAGASRSTSLALDSQDNPAIAWQDTTLGTPEILFSKHLESCTGPVQAQSLTVDVLGKDIFYATLSIDEVLAGGTASHFLSNNGGATWESITPATQHTFTSTGSDLRWKVVLVPGTGPEIGACPSINSLSIDYSVEASTQFIRIVGDDQVEKSINVSRQRFTNPSDATAGLITRSDIAVDSFTAGPLVNLANATILLNDPDVLEPRVLDELNRALGLGSGKTVYVAGGVDAISTQIERDLQAAGFSIKRLGDANRRGTAVKIAEEIITLNPNPTTKIFMSEDERLADALGTNAVAGDLSRNAGNAVPIVLNKRGDDRIDPFTDGFLEIQTEIVELQLVGGAVALAASLPTTLQSKYHNLASVTRVDGLDRFDTNVNLIEQNFPAPDTVIIAAGEKDALPGARSLEQNSIDYDIFFSALLAGPYAAESSWPLLITRINTLPSESELYLASNSSAIKTVVIVGSLSEVSQAVEDKIRGLF